MTKCNSARPRREARRNILAAKRTLAMMAHNLGQARAALNKKRQKK